MGPGAEVGAFLYQHGIGVAIASLVGAVFLPVHVPSTTRLLMAAEA
jgi:hypothetical protein